ncbi:MmgE/PrpD family protein [Brucella anthropi]|uniref:MmgE/PrpD family protein n=1 Tax=Brucella anthropi TaxID=529 RepID=UPI001F407832|nr:MmgE/PrpD family protein [Brucella anthropi]
MSSRASTSRSTRYACPPTPRSDVVSGIVRREGIAAADIQEIVCDVPPVVVANLIYVSPETVREAQFSMEFALAAAACFGELGLDQLKPEILHSEEVRALMARVRMLSGPDWDLPRRIAAPEGASILLTLKDGRRFSGFCSHAPGTAANPLPAEEIETKFLGGTQNRPGCPSRPRSLAGAQSSRCGCTGSRSFKTRFPGSTEMRLIQT